MNNKRVDDDCFPTKVLNAFLITNLFTETKI